MDLSQITPKPTSFKLKSTGREYQLRLINLEDESWIQEEFQGDYVSIFEDNNKLSRLIYRLIEDKEPFIKQEVTIINEDGDKSNETIGGYRLLKRMICGTADKIEMINAFNKVLGVSHPVAEEVSEELRPGDDKKKV